jgi:hypothetical protein
MLFYARSFSLHDVIRYNRKQIIRLSHDTITLKLINDLNKFINSNISRNDPTTQKRIYEDIIMNEQFDAEYYEARIESLKNDLRVSRDINKSLRDKISHLRELLKNQNDRDKK